MTTNYTNERPFKVTPNSKLLEDQNQKLIKLKSLIIMSLTAYGIAGYIHYYKKFRKVKKPSENK